MKQPNHKPSIANWPLDFGPTLSDPRRCCSSSGVCAPSKHEAVQPMLVQCWPFVFDAGPTLYQHRLNGLVFAGCSLWTHRAAGTCEHTVTVVTDTCRVTSGFKRSSQNWAIFISVRRWLDAGPTHFYNPYQNDPHLNKISNEWDWMPLSKTRWYIDLLIA